MRSTHSYEEVPINDYQTPGLFNIKGCYVKILTSNIEPYQTLNPATLLPVREGGPSHDCGEVLEDIHASRSDLRDQLIPGLGWVLYTDGTSLIKQGQRLSGHAIVTEKTIIEAGCLPQHWPAQRAEL